MDPGTLQTDQTQPGGDFAPPQFSFDAPDAGGEPEMGQPPEDGGEGDGGPGLRDYLEQNPRAKAEYERERAQQAFEGRRTNRELRQKVDALADQLQQTQGVLNQMVQNGFQPAQHGQQPNGNGQEQAPDMDAEFQRAAETGDWSRVRRLMDQSVQDRAQQIIDQRLQQSQQGLMEQFQQEHQAGMERLGNFLEWSGAKEQIQKLAGLTEDGELNQSHPIYQELDAMMQQATASNRGFLSPEIVNKVLVPGVKRLVGRHAQAAQQRAQAGAASQAGRFAPQVGAQRTQSVSVNPMKLFRQGPDQRVEFVGTSELPPQQLDSLPLAHRHAYQAALTKLLSPE